MNNELSKIIGERINTLLANQGKKQKELAEYLKVPDNTISYFVSGKRMPNTEQIKKIAEFFNVSADYLLGLSAHSTQDKNLSFVANYLGIDENTCKIIHDKKFEEHTKQFIKFLFNDKLIFKELDFYFSTVALFDLHNSLYKHLPIKPQYSYMNKKNLADRFAFSSLLESLPFAKIRFRKSIEDKKNIFEQIKFEIMSYCIDMRSLKKEVDIYKENPDYIPEEQAIDEFEKIRNFKIEIYDRIIDLIRTKSEEADNVNNP